MKSLVLGIGNPLRGDDGVGVYAVETLARDAGLNRKADFQVFFSTGMPLLTSLIQYGKVICVDSVQSLGAPPGQIWRIAAEKIDPGILPLRLSHGFGIHSVCALARAIGYTRPQEMVFILVNIAPQDLHCQCRDSLSPQIARKVPRLKSFIRDEILRGVS